MPATATGCATPWQKQGWKKCASDSILKGPRLSSPEMFPVAILAGGLAMRLRPITEKIPKALVEVAGKPFINRQLEYLRTQGITRVVLCVGFLGERIEAVVKDGRAFGLEVEIGRASCRERV